MRLEVARIASLQGEMRPPSDKSLTHRAYMLASIATGRSVVKSPLTGEDCGATLRCLRQLGLEAEWLGADEVALSPAGEWRQPEGTLDCGNSGTTIRLMSGLLAGRPLDVTLTGDASLRRRPMKRIADPLRRMGAHIEGDTPPLHIVGRTLSGIDFASSVASAQVKSCVLLAGLRATGETWVSEPALSRDHTERMLRGLGVPVLGEGRHVGVRGGTSFGGFFFDVPGDMSSAAFFMVAAAIVPESRLRLHDLSLNPTRTGILEVFAQCGVGKAVSDAQDRMGEPAGCVEVWATDGLQAFEISGELVPRLIDEIPVLAVLATQCDGLSTIRGAQELRVKESDRIEQVAIGLRAMGAKVETFEDGMAIEGPVRLKGTTIEANGDHRVAMAFAVAGLVGDGRTTIEGAETIATSFPAFERELWRLSIV